LVGTNALVAVGDRLVALTDLGISYLDPKTLKPVPSAKV
jgi:hypothetical protein